MSDKTIHRSAKLLELGLRFDGQQLVYQDINFHVTDLLCMTDAEFNKAYEGVVKRKATLDSAGMQEDNDNATTRFENGGDGAYFSK
jgi:hypothetical protein